MSPPFWIHCNECNALIEKDIRFFILSCSHIMCIDCLKPTRGKKCPTCNADVRCEEFSKLPEKLKNNFQPKIQKLFQEPAKIIQFQQTQIRDFAKKTRDYRAKYRQAKEILEKEKADVMKLKKQLDEAIHQRKLMQEKLKQIYIQNKKKEQHQVYRNPANLTLSSDFSSEIHRSSVRTLQARSNFFDQNSTISSGSTDFFGNSTSTPRKKAKKFDHTQSGRNPFSF